MVALRRYRKQGIAVALAIQGHHIGLQQVGKSVLRALREARPTEGCTITEDDPDVLLQRLAADGLELPSLERTFFAPTGPRVSTMLDLRMLFSALVDADFLETEAHFDRDDQGLERLAGGQAGEEDLEGDAAWRSPRGRPFVVLPGSPTRHDKIFSVTPT